MLYLAFQYASTRALLSDIFVTAYGPTTVCNDDPVHKMEFHSALADFFSIFIRSQLHDLEVVHIELKLRA